MKWLNVSYEKMAMTEVSTARSPLTLTTDSPPAGRRCNLGQIYVPCQSNRKEWVNLKMSERQDEIHRRGAEHAEEAQRVEFILCLISASLR